MGTRTVTVELDGAPPVVYQNVPDTVTPDAIEQRVASEYQGRKILSIDGGRSTPDAMSRQASDLQSVTPAELIAANPMARVVTAAAMPVLGAGRLIERAYGGTKIGDTIDQLRTMQQRGNEALFPTPRAVFGYGTVGDAADIAGSVLSPVTALAAKIPAAASIIGRVAQGGGLGAVAGLTAGTPEPLQAGAVGGVTGAAIPAAVEAAKGIGSTVYHFAEPAFNQAAIKGRAFLDAAGDKADEIINLLRQNKELVPGSLPSAGEAATPAGRAEFSALQRAASNVNPSPYVARADEQNAARIAQVRTVGKTPAELSAAQAAREAEAIKNYGDAYQQAIKADPRLAQLATNPYFKDAVPDALKLAEANGIDPKGNLTQFLHYVKISLDKQLGRTGDTALAGTEKQSVQMLKNQLMTWLSVKNPAYENARQAFARASKPINQMQVGQYLEDKLTPALDESGKQRAAVYAQAIRDAPGTIQRAAAGSPRFKELSAVLDPQQIEAVNSVREDLARSARQDLLASRGAQAAPDFHTTPKTVFPAFFSRVATVANAIIARAQGKMNKQMAAELATEMLNPPVVAESLAAARQRAIRNKMIAARVQQVLTIGNPTASRVAAENQ